MNKKLFKGALVLFASILMAVSCSNNSTGGGNDGNGNGSTDGDGTKQETVTLDKAALLKAIQDLGEVGDGSATGQADKYDFKGINGIANGATTPPELEGKQASGDVTKNKTKEALEKGLKGLNSVEGFKVTVDVSKFDQASGKNAAEITLTIEPADATTAKKYVFAEDLTGALTEGKKLVLKFKPGSGAGNWA